MTDLDSSDSTVEERLRHRKSSATIVKESPTPTVSSETPDEVIWGKTPSGHGDYRLGEYNPDN
jgi:hypothetical protein